MTKGKMKNANKKKAKNSKTNPGRSGRSNGMDLVMGIMHFATHIAMGMKVNKRLKTFWKVTPPGRLAKGITRLINILKTLLNAVLGRKKQRSAKTVWVLFSMLALMVAMEIEQQGTSLVIKPQRSDVGRPVRVSTGYCMFSAMDIGITCEKTIQYECVTLTTSEEPFDVDCYCRNVTNVLVEYSTCNPTVERAKRSLVIQDHPHSETVAKPTLWLKWNTVNDRVGMTEEWVMRNTWKATILTLAIIAVTGLNWKGVLLLVVALMFAPNLATNCVSIQKRDILRGSGSTTWFDVLLEKGSCVTIVADDRPTVDIWLDRITHESPIAGREYCMRVDISGLKIATRCPTLGEAYLSEEHTEDYVCKRGFSDRGWGNGCGLFGKGSIVGCVKTTCKSSGIAKSYSYDIPKVKYVISTEVHKGELISGNVSASVVSATFSSEAEKHSMELEDYGRLEFTCRVVSGSNLGSVRILEIDNHYFNVHEDWLLDLPLPWRIPDGHWHDLGKLIAFKEPHAVKMVVQAYGDQRASLLKSLVKAEEIAKSGNSYYLPGGHVDCRVSLVNLKLKGTTYPYCGDSFVWKRRPTATHHGTVAMEVTYQGTDVPCKVSVIVEKDGQNGGNAGSLITSNPIITAQGSSVFLELEVPLGFSTIKVGAAKQQWRQDGSSIGKAMARASRAFEQTLMTAGSYWQSTDTVTSFSLMRMIRAPLAMLFGDVGFMGKMIISIVCIWFAMNSRNMTLSLVLGVLGFGLLAFTTGVMGDQGCVLDISRKEMKCGDGLMIWNEINDFKHGYKYYPEDPETFLASLVQDGEKHCGYQPSNLIELRMWQSLEKELNLYLEDQKIGWNIKVAEEMKHFPKTINVGWERRQGRTGLTWTNWMKSMPGIHHFMNKNTDLTGTYFVGSIGLDECPASNRSWNAFKVAEFGVGLVHTRAFIDIRNQPSLTCDLGLIGSAAKDRMIVHGSPWMWMESYEVNGTVQLQKLTLTHTVECLWPITHTLGNRMVLDSKLILPKEMGGPASILNMVEGYSEQNKCPWNQGPVTVERGYCEGTEVEISEDCEERGPCTRSKTQGGTTIPHWCCRECKLPPLKFTNPDGCWYAMEIRPVKAHVGLVSAQNEMSPLDARCWGVFSILVLYYLGILTKIEKGNWGPSLIVTISIMMWLHIIDVTELLHYLLAVGYTFVWQTSEPMLWIVAMQAIFQLRPGFAVGFALCKTWRFERIVGMVACMWTIQELTTPYEAFWRFMDALGLLVYAYSASHSTRQSYLYVVLMLSLTKIQNATIRLAVGMFGTMLLMLVGRKFAESDWLQKTKVTIAGATRLMELPYFPLVVSYFMRGQPSKRATDYMSILGVVMALGAAVCRNGINTDPWIIGVMALVLLFFLFQVSSGEMVAEWAGYHEWKKDCPKSVGSISLEVKRMADGRLINMSKEKDSLWEMGIVGCGMVVTAMHWIGIPLTIVALAIKSGLDGKRRSLYLLGLGEGEPESNQRITDGVYRIKVSSLFGKKQVGVGVWSEGSFHTMWHVTRGATLRIGDRKLSPEWANITEDLISYNGGWKLEKKWKGEEVQLHAFTPSNETVVTQLLPGSMKTEKGEELGLIPLDFPPGTSGSPIITSSGHVVGLYGNGIIHGDVYCSSIAQAKEVVKEETVKAVEGDEWLAKGKITVIDAHPGSGKTHKILPSLVRRASERRMRTLVLAPTRVVIKEMENALRGMDVSFHSSAVSSKTPGSLIDVMCHATFVNRKLIHMPQKNYELIIMDEAHWTDPSSIAARGFITTMSENKKCAVVLMTATPPGVQDPWANSNEKIEDVVKVIPEGPWKQGHEWITEFEGRTAWFVPSQNAAQGIAKTLREHGKKVAILTSKTFHDVYPKLKTEKPDFILTTDISEMGANFDVERVIDPRTTLKPIEKGNTVEISGEIQITPASAAQRRGRVGRTPGKMAQYIYQGEVEPDDSELVCWKEGQMLLDNMSVKQSMICTFYGPEQEKMPETPGFFRLSEEKRKVFRHLITQCDFTPWLAWNVASGTKGIEDRDWVNLGPKENLVTDENDDPIVYKSPGGKEHKLAPVWLDTRLTRERKDLAGFIEYAEKRRSSVLTAIPGLLYSRFLSAFDTIYIYSTSDPSSRAFKMAERELPEAILCVLQGFLMCVGMLALIVWLVTRTKVDRMCIGFCVIVMSGIMAWIGGAPLSLVAALVLISFILLVCLIPEQGMQRTQIDTTLATLVLAIVTFGLLVFANEMRWLENTKKDLFGQPQTSPSVNTGGIIQDLLQLDIRPMNVWGTYVALVTVARPQALHNLKMFTKKIVSGVVAGKESAMERLPTGGAWMNLRMGDLTLLATTLKGMTCFNLLGGLTFAFIHWFWFFPLHEAAESAKAHKIVTQSLSKNNMVDGEVIYQLDEVRAETETNERNFSLGVAGCLALLNIVMCRKPWTVLEALMIISVVAKNYLDPKAETFWTLPVASGLSALLRNEFLGLVPIGYRVWKHLSPGRRGLSLSHLTLGEDWKLKLNKMTKSDFLEYRTRLITEVDRGEAVYQLGRGKTNTGHAVSRGTSKLAWMHERSLVRLEGCVVDLGCGRGGWSYYSAAQNPVRKVDAYTLGYGGHEKPRLVETLGWNLITFKAKTDVFSLNPYSCDTILCDIGESNPSYAVEAQRTIRVIDLMERWLKVNPQANFCFKVLTPYTGNVLERLHSFQTRFGGGLVRVPLSRNSTHEMYFVSGITNNVVGTVNAVSRKLLQRMSAKGGSRVIEDIRFPLGTRSNLTNLVKADRKIIQRRIDKIKSENKNFWMEDTNHPYRTWEYHGSYHIRDVGTKCSAPNLVVKLLSWPWQALESVVSMSMTDTTAFGQQRVFKEKVDTKAPEPRVEVKKVMRVVFNWLVHVILKNGGKVRKCTREEFIKKVESHAAIGAWSKDIPEWGSAVEAVHDERFWNMVDKERQLHLTGDCEMCVYNLMGKREKKPGDFGVAKGSRTIWYMWLGSRFLEFESFGFLNEEHWASRELCGGGVEGIPLFYLGYHLEKMAEKAGILYADDTAGWDTRITMADLEDEYTLTELMEGEHKKLAETLFNFAYKNKVALCPRPGKNGGTVLDVISRTDQRGSGQVVTYALNTLTNIKVQLIRMAESEGVLDEEFHDNGMLKWLEKHGRDRLQRLMVSGDDCVVNAIDERFGKSLVWLNEMQKIRKDIDLWKPSAGHCNWEEVEFCSNHFHKLVMRDGRTLVVPCRHEVELVGRASVNQGGSTGISGTACLAKAYAQMWLLLYFHRRDLRILGMAICSAVPANWVPTGRTTWSLHATKDWMTVDDMLSVWNRIWIEENPWMKNKQPVREWNAIPYLPRREDINCGSLIGTSKRSTWATLVPGAVMKVRNLFGPEKFSNYMDCIGRYHVGHQDFCLY
ncbi:polyprotein [Montana myotis leukoencephalitis virus]|uniref:Genome polyprotein n=18 Tax=Montana myotis leukoencephalitis virus TaxID=64312 RepID=Q8JJZ3_9FLAV|nr:polyprotein [Montana myotis leukoencephalitis virus]CAC82713.1 polyprotein [Montana myotis leukoencephalitis virus]